MYQSITIELLIDAKYPRRAFQDAGRSDPAGHLRTVVPGRGTDGRGTDRAFRRFPAGRLETPGAPEKGQARARPSRGPPDALQRAIERARPADRLDQQDDRVLAEAVRSTTG